MKAVVLNANDIKCLREHLDAIESIIQKHGEHNTELKKSSVAVPRETKTQKINKYKDLITSGLRGKKPNHLKNKN